MDYGISKNPAVTIGIYDIHDIQAATKFGVLGIDANNRAIRQKIDAALAKERARVEEDRKQREQKEYPQKVLAAHQDFNEVVTAENMDYLEFHHPEIATAIKYMPEGFDKWSTIYKAIKKHIPNNSTSAKEQKKAEKNMNKPQSMAAGLSGTGDSAPRILDQAAKDANWQRMNRVMKGLPI